MDTLNAEQQALLSSIMSQSSQHQSVVIPTQDEVPTPAVDSNRLLSQSEIDALIASMTGT